MGKAEPATPPATSEQPGAPEPDAAGGSVAPVELAAPWPTPEAEEEPPQAKRAPRGLRGARRFHYLFSPRLWLQRLVFWVGAIAIAGVAIVFAMGAARLDVLLHRGLVWSPYLPFVITPLGMALVVGLTRFFRGSEGSGIPQTIAALSMREIGMRSKVLSLRIAAGKIGLTLLALISGASVGREGPTVQIGASIMHAIGRVTRFSRHDLDKGLILAGGAAGISAAFNTPLAGIVFAIEEMSRSFEERTSGTITTAVIVGGVVSLAVLGDYTYFGHTAASLRFGEGWIAVGVCGVAGGLLGGVFSYLLLLAARGLPGRLGPFMREQPVAFGALCGLLLAIIGFASHGTTFGTGYSEARSIVEHTESMPASFGILKMLATVVSYVSGIPGGIFSPSLAAGAGFGANLALFMPYAPPAAVALLGMVAYFAGVVQAPITSFVIVMEMTDNHEMLLPLMATSLIATGISRLVCPEPLYAKLAEGFLPPGVRPRHH
jgi:H+/Cl- antiporter ClcA